VQVYSFWAGAGADQHRPARSDHPDRRSPEQTRDRPDHPRTAASSPSSRSPRPPLAASLSASTPGSGRPVCARGVIGFSRYRP